MIKTNFNPNPTTPGLLWRIYYYDPENPDVPKTFSNLDGTVAEAPDTLVMCILMTTANGDRFELTTADYYFVDNEGKWGGGDAWGVEDRNKKSIPYENIKYGYWVNMDRWNKLVTIWGRAKDFPNPLYRGERYKGEI